MKLRHLWLPAAAIIGALLYGGLSKSATSRSAEASANPSVAPEPSVATPTAVQAAALPDNTLIEKPLSALVPDKKTVREEVERDPHSTPPSLLKFSVELNHKQIAALLSEDRATAFLTELKTCALEKESLNSVQALCLLNAKRLAKSYPALQNEYQSLE